MLSKNKFFENFFWGAATSAHQVEGGNYNDWSEWEKLTATDKVRSIKLRQWPEYLLKSYPNPLQVENYVSGRACDHYSCFEKDFDIAKELGHNAHRFSIEWSCIEPKKGEFNHQELEHYRQVILALRERGLEPFVTLWHWPIPVWLRDKGGWESKEVIGYFSRYVDFVVRGLGGQVKFWITLNEPTVYASNSYFRGWWPPQKRSMFAYFKVVRNLIKAHQESCKVIKKINPNAQVGIAHHTVWFEAYKNHFINRIMKWIADLLVNYHFLNHISDYQDFIGLNNYFHNRINYGFNKNENKVVSDLGWEVYPGALYGVLKDLSRYQKPIYITENGVADGLDILRGDFIEESISWIKKAMAEGVDVRAYFHWSLLDNFEWAYGFWPRFGLVEVDYKTMARKIRPSAWKYKKIIEEWRKLE